jgi:hypothetical protein
MVKHPSDDRFFGPPNNAVWGLEPHYHVRDPLQGGSRTRCLGLVASTGSHGIQKITTLTNRLHAAEISTLRGHSLAAHSRNVEAGKRRPSPAGDGLDV